VNRATLVRLVPNQLRRRYRRIYSQWEQRQFRGLDVSETFTKIYRDRKWDVEPTANFRFDSGPGSVGAAADQYTVWIQELISKHNIRSAVDLGCGDFQIGARIAPMLDSYLGLDVVEELLQINRQSSPTNATFRFHDATLQTIPSADVILVRQVLQHLSNAEITQVMAHIPTNTRVVITESRPLNLNARPNIDISHGPHTRLPLGSYVDLESAPFLVKGFEVLGVVRTTEEEIRTSMFVSSRLGSA
jgi:2-polyprenyl-3-methyl-5-hydroxy-6-metoxy-1,4-benzoquinol methylase